MGAVIKELKIELAPIEQSLLDVIGRKININSTQQLSDYIFNECEFDRVAGGKDESLDKRQLKALNWKYHRDTNLFSLLLDYKEKIAELRYIKGLDKLLYNDTVFPHYNQTGTI